MTRPDPKPARRDVLHAEVMREFGEQEPPSRSMRVIMVDEAHMYERGPSHAQADDWDAAADHALYLAPWRDQLIDGTLGPWHGPTTESRYNEQVRRFEDECRGGIGSPALFSQEDYEAMHSTRSATKKATRAALRNDYEALTALVRREGDTLPRRELEVYYAYWRDGLSVHQTAVRLAVGEQSVQGWIKALRKRVEKRAWVAGESEALVEEQRRDQEGE